VGKTCGGAFGCGNFGIGGENCGCFCLNSEVEVLQVYGRTKEREEIHQFSIRSYLL
jgi:hypothetical protein